MRGATIRKTGAGESLDKLTNTQRPIGGGRFDLFFLIDEVEPTVTPATPSRISLSLEP